MVVGGGGGGGRHVLGRTKRYNKFMEIVTTRSSIDPEKLPPPSFFH